MYSNKKCNLALESHTVGLSCQQVERDFLIKNIFAKPCFEKSLPQAKIKRRQTNFLAVQSSDWNFCEDLRGAGDQQLKTT